MSSSGSTPIVVALSKKAVSKLARAAVSSPLRMGIFNAAHRSSASASWIKARSENGSLARAEMSLAEDLRGERRLARGGSSLLTSSTVPVSNK
jgi:hypothetical protein